MEVETMAALDYSKDTGFAKLQIQTDSLALKCILLGERKPPWELIEKIEKIQELLHNQEIKILHIYRESNQLADTITNEAFKHDNKI